MLMNRKRGILFAIFILTSPTNLVVKSRRVQWNIKGIV
jgi:hypothetical protein